MDQPLDEAYLRWLYHLVASVRYKNPARTYWSLLRQLYTKEFVWWVPNDDNRAEDGRDLRYEFMEETGTEADLDWIEIGCSFLEMLIALSRRLAFESETDSDSRSWFWHLLENLGIRHFNDAYLNGPRNEEVVDSVLNEVIWRTYQRNGRGGLFPLQNSKRDQRDVELWYQLSNYLLEKE